MASLEPLYVRSTTQPGREYLHLHNKTKTLPTLSTARPRHGSLTKMAIVRATTKHSQSMKFPSTEANAAISRCRRGLCRFLPMGSDEPVPSTSGRHPASEARMISPSLTTKLENGIFPPRGATLPCSRGWRLVGFPSIGLGNADGGVRPGPGTLRLRSSVDGRRIDGCSVKMARIGRK